LFVRFLGDHFGKIWKIRFLDHIEIMAALAKGDGPQPKSMSRPKQWTEEVEEAYRFQLAGYRDAMEYDHLKGDAGIDRWPHNNFVKKLQRRDGYFYYYNKARECPDKEVHKTKMYVY